MTTDVGDRAGSDDRPAPGGVEGVARLGNALLDEVERAVVGKRAVLELVLIGLLADGHVLLEDVPGVAKTLMARSFAACCAPAAAPALGRKTGNSTRTTTVNRSSTTSQPTAMCPDGVCRSLLSASTRSNTTVLATEMASPNTTPACHDQPTARPNSRPSMVATRLCPIAPGTATFRGLPRRDVEQRVVVDPVVALVQRSAQQPGRKLCRRQELGGEGSHEDVRG